MCLAADPNVSYSQPSQDTDKIKKLKSARDLNEHRVDDDAISVCDVEGQSPMKSEYHGK